MPFVPGRKESSTDKGYFPFKEIDWISLKLSNSKATPVKPKLLESTKVNRPPELDSHNLTVESEAPVTRHLSWYPRADIDLECACTLRVEVH